jgi:hypothetical protein
MKDLTVPIEGIDHEQLLGEWRWLIPQRMTILSITLLGDVFLRDSDGSIHWLDVAGGKLSKVADSEAAFESALRDEALRDNWFLPQVISELAAKGSKLKPRQCYSYKKPPCLGGSFDAANFEPTDLVVHFSILGQIHAQIKDLPEGTPIGKITLK